MNDKIGRNDLCTCGSGKKYKRCCMTVFTSQQEVVDFEWRNLRRLEGAIIDQHLTTYVTQKLSRNIIKLAMADFFPENLPEGMDEELLFNSFFMPWFLFNWILDEETDLDNFDPKVTVAENYIKCYEEKLTNPEKQFINTVIKTYYSFYSVLEVELDKSLTVKDIMMGTTHLIKERQGTHGLKRGDVIFSRILAINNQSIFIGMAPFIIPAAYHNDLIDFRKWLLEEVERKQFVPEDLRNEVNIDLLEYFFEIMEAIYNEPLPTLCNTDGDLLQFCKSYFKLTVDPEEALTRLLSLTLSSDPDEFLQDAKRDKTGNIKKIEFPWLKKGNKQHKTWDNTVMGHIILEEGKLILETNSERRTQKGKKLLSKYLDGAIEFRKTLIEFPEQKMKSRPTLGENNTPNEEHLLQLPEVQVHIKAMAQSYWDTWFDERIPILDNKTPREAAKTAEGREKLDALLLQYERSNLERKDNDPFKADVGYLRAELGLTEQ